jgi:hypothetical protein
MNTEKRERKYWASRPDRKSLDYFYSQLKEEGKLRIGWGYEPDQNLDLIRNIQDEGGDWWNKLTSAQQDAYRNYPFNPRWGEDTIRKGDYVLIPNIPTFGFLSLAEVLDDVYHYDENGDKDYDDYRHWRSVKIINHNGINKNNSEVDAYIRETLQCRSRIWRIGHLKNSIDSLILKFKNNELQTEVGEDSINRCLRIIGDAKEKSIKIAYETAKEYLEEKVGSSFHASELEGALKVILEKILPNGTEVVHNAGGAPEAEHGTDLLIKIPNRLKSDDFFLIAAQVKCHHGETNSGAEQLLKAVKYWSEHKGEGQLIGVALVTTAEKLMPNASAMLEKLRQEYNLGVYELTNKELINLFVDAALSSD